MYDVVGFSVVLPEGWYAMPVDDTAWAAALSDRIAPHEVRERLEQSLREVQDGTRAFADSTMRAAVFVEFPETGSVSGMLVQALASRDTLGDPDRLVAALEQPQRQTSDGASGYGVQTWRQDLPAGAAVGAHYLLAHPMGEDAGMLEERVVVTVYPPDAAQAVQLVATANGIEAFPDMASSMMAIAATLAVDLGERV